MWSSSIPGVCLPVRRFRLAEFMLIFKGETRSRRSGRRVPVGGQATVNKCEPSPLICLTLHSFAWGAGQQGLGLVGNGPWLNRVRTWVGGHAAGFEEEGGLNARRESLDKRG